MEVGDGSLPEFEGKEKGGCRKLGGVEDEELMIRPYYPANVSRRRQGIDNNKVGLLGTRMKKPIVVEKAE